MRFSLLSSSAWNRVDHQPSPFVRHRPLVNNNQLLLHFYPASREVWQQWFEQQKRAGPGGANSGTTGEP
jgi:hypothetical protein